MIMMATPKLIDGLIGMTKRDIRNAAVCMAVQAAIRKIGLDTIRQSPFFGMNESLQRAIQEAA